MTERDQKRWNHGELPRCGAVRDQQAALIADEDRADTVSTDLGLATSIFDHIPPFARPLLDAAPIASASRHIRDRSISRSTRNFAMPPVV